MNPNKLKIGDLVLVPSGKPVPGREHLPYLIFEPDTPATIVGIGKVRGLEGRLTDIHVVLESGTRGAFNAFDIGLHVDCDIKTDCAA